MPGQSNLPLTFCAWLGPVLVPFPALLISSPLFVILSPIPHASPPGLCTASTNEASRLERAGRGKRGMQPVKTCGIWSTTGVCVCGVCV